MLVPPPPPEVGVAVGVLVAAGLIGVAVDTAVGVAVAAGAAQPGSANVRLTDDWRRIESEIEATRFVEVPQAP